MLWFIHIPRRRRINERRLPVRGRGQGERLMNKGERVSRAGKRSGSQKGRHKVRSSQIKVKASRSTRKTVRRVTVFKSTSWYQTAAQSIGISPRAAP
jgi:hypothetical protein